MRRYNDAVRALCLVLVLLLLPFATGCGTSASAQEKASGRYGDLDGDGVVGAFDLVRLQQSTVSKTEGDLNGDGVTDETDVTLLLEYAAGIHTKFPVECTHEGEKVMFTNGVSPTFCCNICGASHEANLRVAYLPLDNRPVNQERVIYLAQSAGIELVMPPEQMYRTALDNMKPNDDGSTIGNRRAILEWLREADKTCDYFIISLDQALSGGLVGSRWLDNTDLSFEYEIADEIIRLCRENHVILFDTVMRLASTVSYQGYTITEYSELRAYGQAARKQLYGDQLTVENIIAGYRYDKQGKPVKTSLSESALKKYHASRVRKLKLADYILRTAGDSMDCIYIGVDDSTPQTTIQSNEIRYLTELVGDRGVLSAAADELGLCCLTRLIGQLYGQVEMGITYYGNGKDMAADDYDIGTLGSNLQTHLDFLLVKEIPEKDRGLQALILTRYCTTQDRRNLMEQLKTNLQKSIPTLLLDVSGEPASLAQMLFEQSDIEVGMLFGYSSWNTAGNAMGIALSQGIARYAYLSATEHSSADANEGFLKSMTFGYIKDISYKAFHATLDGLQSNNYPCSVPLILRRLNESRIVTSLAPYTPSSHGKVTATGFRYPWNRNFEMTFDIACK